MTILYNARVWIVLSGLNGFVAVAASAMGAHALAQSATPQELAWMQQGADIQILHALALLGIGIWGVTLGRSRSLLITGILFTLGILFFSGSLYRLALAGSGSLGPLHFITPIGGLMLQAGWLAVAYTGWAALRKKNGP